MWPLKCDATDSPSIPTVLVTLFTVIWLFGTIKKSRDSVPLHQLPPGPIGLQLVGYLPFLKKDLHQKFDELARVYGPIFKLKLGTKLFVLVSSPTLVKEVVRDQDTTFADRDPPISAFVATYGELDIAFSSYGPTWKKLRKMFVREMLSNTNINNSFPHRRTEVQKFIKYVYDKTGQPIDVGELNFLTAMNSVMSTVWGETLQREDGDAIGGEFKALVKELMVLFGKPNISDVFPALVRFDLQGIERKTKRISHWIERIFYSAIEKRINMTAGGEEESGNIEKRQDFVQYLLELRERDSDSESITMNQLKAILQWWVGTDTTATMSEWVMAELMQHPETTKRVNEELEAVVGLDSCVQESHLPKLCYLNAVVKETMRLYPPLPHLVPRCASHSTTLGGYALPKGTQLFLNMWTIHRDPDVWDNAPEFRPERFLRDPGKFDFSGNDFQYRPFGSGRRVCAGIPLAEKMLMFMLASFLHSFEWKLPSGAELEFSAKFGIVMKKLNPLVAIPTPRLSKLELHSY